MDIVVCIKQVPDPEIPPSQFKVDEAAKRVVPPPGVQPVISTFDLHAIEAAVQLDEPAFEGGDSFATAVALAAAIRKLGAFDLVLTGRQASDWDSGQVPSALAELLGVAGAVPVQKVEVR